MDMNSSHLMSTWTILLMLSSIWSVYALNNNFIVTDFGAIPDGKTDNKQAFQNAWKKACQTDGGTISVPKGTFYVSFGDFHGPCIGKTLFSVDGTIIASSSNSNVNFWLTFNNIDGLTFFGIGTLDGNGASTWSRCKGSGSCSNRPITLKLENVKNALIQGVYFLNAKFFHLAIDDSQNVNVQKVSISAPEDSPNTDGIHIARSNYVSVMDSNIGTGDDCVSMGDGSRNVNISSVSCGPGHGFSIGSLGKYKGEQDVSGIMVSHCTLNNTDNGLRIKTWAPSQSTNIVSNVIFSNIDLDMVGNPIIIDQYYCPSGACASKGESSVQIKGVKYVDVRGTSSIATTVNIKCSKSKPCQDINLVGVDITFKGQPTKAICSNPSVVQFQGSSQVPSSCS